ncbi:MAG: hypothetical protein U0610_20390 [bacterium]
MAVDGHQVVAEALVGVVGTGTPLRIASWQAARRSREVVLGDYHEIR